MVPFISIIVPVYNGEKFIVRLIKTVENQTIHNFEMICVDDGSTDDTAKFLDDYEKKYEWLTVIHQDNKGLADARNSGIERALGEYIMFLDADDYWESNTIEQVTDRIKKYHPDLLDFGMYYIDDSENKNPGHHKLPKEQILDKEIIDSRIIPHLINVKSDPDAFIYDYAWNKVYKRSIIIDNNIRFPVGRRTWEDRPFVVDYLRYIETYFSIDAYLYNYVSVDNSLSRRYDLQFFNIILENYSLYYSWFSKKYDFTSLYVNQYWSRSIENMVLRSIGQTINKDIIRENIEDALTNKMVLNWFENRNANTERDRKVNSYVLSGDIDGLIAMYSKELKEKNKKEKINQFKYRLRSFIKR
jgi:glycosyltransferase involved in cell wall biosynthesis